MESFQKQAGSIKGTEILRFDEAEISKGKAGSNSFAAMGPLSVLYLKEYNRFFLQLNDWKYPLLRRLPITATAASEIGDVSSRSYILPAMNGYTYHLKINATPSQANALSNLETVFSNNSHFLLAGHEGKKLEASPEDKLVRPTGKSTSTGPGPMQVISDAAKTIVNKVKSGTKYLTASKTKSNPKGLTIKDFRTTAKPTFKKEFFQTSEKLSGEFNRLRKENPSMSDVKEFSSLKSGSGPSLYLRKDDIENLILDSRDIFTQGHYETVGEFKKKGLMGTIKEGVQQIKESVVGRRETDAPRELKKPVELESKVVGIEHYQG